MKKFFLLTLIIAFFKVNLFAFSQTFVLPYDSKKAFKTLEKHIKNSSKIDIAVYNFEYKKIAKLLKKQAKKGTKINILFEKSKLENKKAKYDYLCDEKNISCSILKGKKQHIKLMIFDNSIAMIGSANMTKESFTENLELLYFTDDIDAINKINSKLKKYFN